MSSVACPRCGKRLRIPNGFNRPSARCPACKATVPVSPPTESLAAVEPGRYDLSADDSSEAVDLADSADRPFEWEPPAVIPVPAAADRIMRPPRRRGSFLWAAFWVLIGIGVGWLCWGRDSAESLIGDGSPFQLAAYLI